jgi:hypothetical protein
MRMEAMHVMSNSRKVEANNADGARPLVAISIIHINSLFIEQPP